MKNMRTGFSIAGFAAAILLLLQTLPLASAQDQDYSQDPPARAGRISFVQGSVSFQPGGQGDWVDATTNRTLTVGDNLWVDRDSRAEVQIGSTAIRLGPETSLTFLDVGNNVTQLRLSMGSLFFRVRHYGGDDAFEVDTPNLAFNLNRPGQFRLDVNENGDQTIATVWRGEVEITGAGNSYRLTEGQQGTFSGTEQLSYDVGGIGRGDSFSEWCLSRDERTDRARSRQYVSEEMTGYEDLDDYGRWRNVSGYGNVWSPSGVPGDWAPYRYGHWVWVSPWGWTWVEDEPWGFAPFHYGRWAFIESSWCWVPGPVAVVPVYSPALVAFVGGGGFSIGVGVGGGVGWFPLGPSEVFVPWYRTSPRYVQNVNITNTRVNVTQVTNVYNNVTVNKATNVTYVNQRVNNSVTVVNRETFVNARPVHNNIVRVDARQITSAPVTHEVVRNIQPDRQSVVGPARQIQARPPQQVMTRAVVATRQPVAINRPESVRGMERTAPPPVKTVKAAPPGQAQTLERGAKGTGRPSGAMNEGSPRPGGPENRPGATENRGPGAPANSPANAAPQPGAANQNRQGGDNNRPGADNNRRVPRPGNTEAAPSPGAPENNRPEAAPQPGNPRGAPENRPGQPDNNNRGDKNNNRRNEGSQPENNNQPQQVPRPGNRPDQAPEQQRQTPNARPEGGRPAETPSTRPEQPTRPPDNRQEAEPRGNQNRPEAAPNSRQQRPNQPETRQQNQPETRQQNQPETRQQNQPETRQQNQPETRQQPSPPQQNENRQAAPRPDNRNENVPRPEARPSNQPQHGDNRSQDQQKKGDKSNDKDKNKPPQYR
jgi:FecR protein